MPLNVPVSITSGRCSTGMVVVNVPVGNRKLAFRMPMNAVACTPAPGLPTMPVTASSKPRPEPNCKPLSYACEPRPNIWETGPSTAKRARRRMSSAGMSTMSATSSGLYSCTLSTMRLYAVFTLKPPTVHEPSSSGSAHSADDISLPDAASHTTGGSIIVGFLVVGFTGPSVGSTPRSLMRRNSFVSSRTRNGPTVSRFR